MTGIDPLGSSAQEEISDEFEEFPCDLCGTSDTVEAPHSGEYNRGQPINICTRCGFVYVVRRRSARKIADDWSDVIFGGEYTSAIPAVTARLTFVAEFIAAELGMRDAEVFDIGAGEGHFLDMVRGGKYGASVFGIEPSAANCQRLTGLGIDCFQGTIEDYDAHIEQTSQSADIVTIMWTLENCQSCRGMLSAAHRILKDDGHIVVATGSRVLVPFKKPLHDYYGNGHVDTHAFRFSANTLRGMLAVSGFEVTHVNRYLDSDVLCMIAKKKDPHDKVLFESDSYLEVYNFFERWHAETKLYYPGTGAV